MKLPPCSWDHLRFLGRFGRSKGNPQREEERRNPRKENTGDPKTKKEGQRKTKGRPSLPFPPPSQPPHLMCFGAPVPSLSLSSCGAPIRPPPCGCCCFCSFLVSGRAAITLLLFLSSWGSGWAAPTPRRKEKEGQSRRKKSSTTAQRSGGRREDHPKEGGAVEKTFRLGRGRFLFGPSLLLLSSFLALPQEGRPTPKPRVREQEEWNLSSARMEEEGRQQNTQREVATVPPPSHEREGKTAPPRR